MEYDLAECYMYVNNWHAVPIKGLPYHLKHLNGTMHHKLGHQDCELLTLL